MYIPVGGGNFIVVDFESAAYIPTSLWTVYDVRERKANKEAIQCAYQKVDLSALVYAMGSYSAHQLSVEREFLHPKCHRFFKAPVLPLT